MEESAPLLQRSSIDDGNSHNSGDNNNNDNGSGSISNLVKLGYAFGHAQNDLCGAMYFSYLLVFLEGTGLSPTDAGNVLIVGQLVDGTCTPIVGYISDRWDGLHFNNHDHDGNDDLPCKYEGRVGREDHCWGLAGRRKTWYIGGLFLVTSTFWMLFTPLPIDTSEELLPPPSTLSAVPSLNGVNNGNGLRMGVLSRHPVVCYALANSLFQAGWASVQVAHMSMVPEMTSILSERCFLNSARYAVTVATSITIYILVYLFPSNNKADANADNENPTTPTSSQDLLLKLQDISYIVLLAGALMGLFFVVTVSETSKKNRNIHTGTTTTSTTLSAHADTLDTAFDGGGGPMDSTSRSSSRTLSDSSLGQPPPPKSLGDWFFRTPGFAGVTANYALSRLCGNVLQLYLPFFVLQALPWDPSAVATVPLVAYVGMIASSAVAPRASARIHDAVWLCVGATLVIAAGSALLLVGLDSSNNRSEAVTTSVVFLSSGLLGFGCAQLMVTSQTQVGELVGEDANGGVVFGIASLCDKFSTGVVIYYVQRLVESLSSTSSPSNNDSGSVSLGDIYRYTAAGGTILCAVLACLSLGTVPISIRDRHR